VTRAFAASSWRPQGVPDDGRAPASTLALAVAPDVVWPANWEISGLAYAGWSWMAEVYGLDLDDRDGAPVEVLLYTPIGDFRGLAVVYGVNDTHAGKRITALDGHGDLVRLP
jgi:hypothetical protein